MITKYIEFNIICDNCELSGNHNFLEWCRETDKNNIALMGTELLSTKSIRDLRKKAKKFGWMLKNRKDICPRCSENRGIAKSG